MKSEEIKMENLVSLCKRRGFIVQGSDIYGGLSGTWDYIHYGLILKNNIKKIWWNRFVDNREDIYGVDAAILMNEKVWEASGHVSGFADPLIECKECKHSFRADQLDDNKKCPDCDGELGQERKFNMMLETRIGANGGTASVSYLRPETAQGMFVNFKNIMDTLHPRLPFGMAQIGKAFRNEIAPRDFLFRIREFEQMEIEYFINPKDWEKYFEVFRQEMHNFIIDIGLDKKHVHELEVSDGERAHYSRRTIDFEFDFPFGRKELYGLAYRTDFDLKQHMNLSGVELSYFDEENKEKFIPHCIEPSFGVDRTVLAVLSDAYTVDEINGEKREFLALKPNIAPVKVAVFPLLKNKPELVKKAKEIFNLIKNEFKDVEFDDNGNIGKRYRRQDEIGTPFCITIDFETIEKDNGVTIRDRDTGKQERIAEKDLIKYISNAILNA
ncbi:MAG TPA: glycine--tRNA ligase [Candidatus Paceibacterota bacterium]